MPGELTAEAIRAYMQDPNYIKTVAPALAKEIRKLNSVKGLRDIIQFNTCAHVRTGGWASIMPVRRRRSGLDWEPQRPGRERTPDECRHPQGRPRDGRAEGQAQIPRCAAEGSRVPHPRE